MIISISTVTKECSVFIMHKEKEYYSSYIDTDMIETLPMIISDFTYRSNLSKLETLFVVKGPGYHTGSRIGISFAKGLAANKRNNIIYGDSLEILSYKYPKDGFITSILKARNGIYNFALFERKKNKIKRLSDNELIEEDNLLKKVKGVVIGEGLKYLKKEIIENIHKSDIYYPDAKTTYNFFIEYPEGLK